MKARQWLTAAVTVNCRGARAADARDNRGSVVQGSATAVARARIRRVTAGQRLRCKQRLSRRHWWRLWQR